ncbi:NAD(P)/FAD-dependent oxidoreductase [Radiobacillus kanasensis]|uniref:NAD(P)/FAD-dependent oxidoreductase n=1 Tax=Radiobacillus kanasensis TaxID=2844358 RepID=UPI001E41B693|nr:NAD(P)/FAD-dependent oxidoreductase [Radiobacillus kanasensis]UFU00809.1 NAD(P)/FAD-dependent oxidoreductase [Radiobacillus kanasensis]
MKEKEKKEIFDVTIIGGGTTGLFAAFYCGMRGLTTKVLEGSSFLGGKVAQFYPEKNIYDVGGLPVVSGTDLVEQMKKQAVLHDPEILLNQYVEAIQQVEGKGFEITTQQGDAHYSKTILLTTGFGTYNPVPLEHKDAKEFEETSIHYMMGDLRRFKDKHVAIYSNQRAGVDWALSLGEVAKHVYLFCTEEQFQHVVEADLEKVQQSKNIDLVYDATIGELQGERGSLNGITIISKGASSSYSVDDMLVYQGVKMIPAPFSDWQLEAEKGRLIVDQGMATSVPGIFAAGDGVQYDKKSMLIATGYSEVITALNSLAKYIDPKAPAQVYSTVEYRYKK